MRAYAWCSYSCFPFFFFLFFFFEEAKLNYGERLFIAHLLRCNILMFMEFVFVLLLLYYTIFNRSAAHSSLKREVKRVQFLICLWGVVIGIVILRGYLSMYRCFFRGWVYFLGAVTMGDDGVATLRHCWLPFFFFYFCLPGQKSYTIKNVLNRRKVPFSTFARVFFCPRNWSFSSQKGPDFPPRSVQNSFFPASPGVQLLQEIMTSTISILFDQNRFEAPLDRKYGRKNEYFEVGIDFEQIGSKKRWSWFSATAPFEKRETGLDRF